jgi:hypothetical protein
MEIGLPRERSASRIDDSQFRPVGSRLSDEGG